MDQRPNQSYRAIFQILNGPLISMMLYSATELNIAGLLSTPKRIEELASQTSTLPEKLDRLLLSLEAFGFFNYNLETHEWSNSELSSALADPSVTPMIKWLGSPHHHEMICSLTDSLKVNKSAHELRFGSGCFEYIRENPHMLTAFQDFMTILTLREIPTFVRIELGNAHRILDIGGADGSFMIELCKIHAELTGAVFDLEEVTERATKNIEKNGFQERLAVISGNFLDHVPEGFDCIIIKHTLIDWNDDDSKRIFDNCRKALEPGKNLKIIDPILVRGDPQYQSDRWFDVLLNAYTNSKARTKEELERLLSQSGFRIDSVFRLGRDYVVHAVAI
mmetsp:Transcript_19370/g.19358  ORF Transcript_19370/g.19358 Transcript_19370/m.19358 type:complete len:335 (+) Transcript_19370:15-1019(+)